VQPFAGVLDGEAAAIAGPYAYSFDTNQTGSVTAAGASARVDRLDVQVSDPAESDGSSTPSIQIVYTAGTPGLATAPARSHKLAQINVPATGGGSPTVSWAPDWSGDAGEWAFNTVAERDAYVTAITSANVPVNQRATVLATTADYVWTGSGWGFPQNGMVLMPPSQVVGTGVTLSPLGGVTFTTATQVSLDDVFTSAFDHYQIVLDVDTISASGTVSFKLRTAAHADSTVSTYSYMFQNITGTAAAQGFSNAQVSGTCSGGPASAGQMLTIFEISNPAKALNKQWNGKCAVTDSGNGMTVFSGQIATATAFAGISFIPSAGTITGNVRVYGYNKG